MRPVSVSSPLHGWMSTRAAWSVLPIWTLYQRRSVKGFPHEQLLSVYRDHGVVPKASRNDNFNRESEDLESYLFVEPGDLVINKMKAWQGSVAISNHRGIVSPAYFTYRPRRNSDSRYVQYFLRSRQMIQAYAALSKGIRPNQWDLDPWLFSRLTILYPPADEQTAIADYLDRETARIDALVEKQEQLIATLEERAGVMLDQALIADTSNVAQLPLKRLGEVTVGIVVQPSQWYVDSPGVPALRGLNVRPGQIIDRDLIHISPAGHQAHRKSELKEGDVVVVRTGQAGAAAVVPDRLRGANAIDLLIVRPNPSLSSDFLELFLNAPAIRTRTAGASVGSIQGHLNVGALRELLIPTLTLEQQSQIVSTWRDQIASINTLVGRVQRSSALARERRSALITAAVTGQIDVPSAA